ncbi:acylphosphatase [Lentibacillus sp. Marseille-P4043]|uniref:acylphosphatase n=1 Tax=Lentibacillus sp. Marseille-P4043 TaxID=2040293 RepID=UPI000D0AE8C7|nr:acylphosphatase [Lentibacillus sp. Marseille-P4043]
MLAHIIVSGRVQGVGFRYSAKQSAIKHQLVGWVRNNSNGTVELEVVGDESQVKHYLDILKSGFNRFIRVDDLQLETSEKTTKEFDSFSIR